MPKSLPDKIKSFPYCFLLFPIFFVLHGWKENFEYIGFQDILILCISYLLSSLVVFVIFLALFRHAQKAGIYSFFVLLVFFLFGAMQDFLKAHHLLEPLSKYRYLLSALGLFLIISFVWLKRRKFSLNKLNFFFNILLLVYIAIDAVSMIRMAVKKESTPAATASIQCRECARPDIYFLLFDEYTSSRCLKEFWKYDNYAFDSALQARGFHIIPDSRGNYNSTPFSLASILNMEYVRGVKDFKASTVNDFASCIGLIKNSKVVDFLHRSGYEVLNYSVFDLKGQPSIVDQSFLPLKVKLITDQTLYSRIIKDLGHLLIVGKFELKFLSEKLIYSSLRSNTIFTKELLKVSRQKADHPRFVYAHFFMPHQPFYFDSTGHARDKKILLAERNHFTLNPYLQYVKFTNGKALQLVDSILENNATPPIIMLMGDHGFRRDTAVANFDYLFMNMNAIYLPDGNYVPFYDSISGVNQFRVLFNSEFKQNLQLLNDSTILVVAKRPGQNF